MTAKSRGLYEKVLAAVGKGAAPLPAPRPPRPSAAVVPWRRSSRGLEVFWLQRSPALAFMGGWYAFPGGGLSRADAGVDVAGIPEGAREPPTPAAMPETLIEGLGEPEPHLIPGILACALRELLEETGILPLPELTTRRPPPDGKGDAVAIDAELGEARRELLAGERGFAEIAAALGLILDASRLVFAGRWLTPPLGPLRFDNRFFLLEWPEALPVQPLVVPGEAVAGEWVEPSQALDRWRRGELITAPPITHLLRVLAEDGPWYGLGRLRDPAEANLGPYRRVEFRPGVLMLPLATATLPPATHTNAFLLGHGERVLIDPGAGDETTVERLVEAVRAGEAAGHPTVALWLTHHHPDHVGGVAALARRLEVPVCAHPATAERLRSRGIPVDRELADGQQVILEGDPPMPVRVIHTPGHASGHLCFLDEAGGSLIAGDMVSALSTIVVDPPDGDMDDYLASLEKLLASEPLTLFPAHGPPVTDAPGKLREFLEHRLWREEKILAAWEAGLTTAARIRPRAYDDVPEVAYPLAERQIEAHLERLRRSGKISS